MIKKFNLFLESVSEYRPTRPFFSSWAIDSKKEFPNFLYNKEEVMDFFVDLEDDFDLKLEIIPHFNIVDTVDGILTEVNVDVKCSNLPILTGGISDLPRRTGLTGLDDIYEFSEKYHKILNSIHGFSKRFITSNKMDGFLFDILINRSTNPNQGIIVLKFFKNVLDHGGELEKSYLDYAKKKDKEVKDRREKEKELKLDIHTVMDLILGYVEDMALDYGVPHPDEFISCAYAGVGGDTHAHTVSFCDTVVATFTDHDLIDLDLDRLSSVDYFVNSMLLSDIIGDMTYRQ